MKFPHFQTFGSQMAVRLSALHAGHILPPGRFVVLISVRGWVDPRAIVRLEGLSKLKRSTWSGTRTGDLPACSIVPQPTTLPRAPSCYVQMWILYWRLRYDTYPYNGMEFFSINNPSLVLIFNLQKIYKCILIYSCRSYRFRWFRIKVMRN
jgi:hypothetical protein